MAWHILFFQSLDIFKNQILFGKEFSPLLLAHPAFRPSLSFFYQSIFPPLSTRPRPSGRPSPTGHLSSSSHTEAERARRRHRPASRRLHGRPDASTGREKWPHLIPLHFPPLIGAIAPPLFNPGNRHLQPRH
jgi:hypothetical protein